MDLSWLGKVSATRGRIFSVLPGASYFSKESAPDQPDRLLAPILQARPSAAGAEEFTDEALE